MQALKQILAVFQKEIQSELRTRYAISSLLLFVLTSVSIVVFSNGGQKLSESILSIFLWIIMFFASMTGLSKTFIQEEERGTYIFLMTLSKPGAVYFGKLFFNIVLSLLLNLLSILLMNLFLDDFHIRNAAIFWLTYLLGSISLAAASTIISAIIAKANSKNSLFPVLSFPLLMPIILLGIESTKFALEGWELIHAKDNLVMIFSYIGILVTISYFMFDFVWNE